MGPIGWPETVFIFFLALILFGPKKLPELGRTVGNAITSFQRAKAELQEVFDRESKQLGLDTEMLTNLANQYRVDASSLEAAPAYASSSHSLYGSEAASPETAAAPVMETASSLAVQAS